MNASIKYTMLIIILIITFLPCQSLFAKEHEENVLNSTLPTDDDVFLNNLLIFSGFNLYLADMTFDDILSYQKIEGSEIEFKEQFGKMVLDMSTQTKYDIMSYNPETHIYRFDDLAIYFNEHRRDSVICLFEYSVDNVLNRHGGDDYDHIWIIPKQSTAKCWMYSFDGAPRYAGSFTTEYDKYGRVINYRGQKIQYNAFNRISTLMKYNNTSIIWTDDRTISSIEDLGGFYENRNFEITKRNEKGLWTEMIEYGFDMDGNRINLVLRTRTFKEITKQETSQTTESEKLHQKQPQEEINRMEEAALRRQQEEMAYQESMMEETEEAPISFQLVEIKPSFQGGDTNAFSKWVQENLTYPETAKKNGIYGRVTLQFTVNTDGTVSDITVLRGVDPSLDKEAVRVVSMSPKWTPGKQDGHPVRVTYAFPVIFNLFNSE